MQKNVKHCQGQMTHFFPPNGIKQKAKGCQRIKETKETQMNSLNGSLDFEKTTVKKTI